MNLKIDAVIAIKYSSFYAIGYIVSNTLMFFLYNDSIDDWYLLYSQILGPIYLICFPLVIVLSHRNYLRQIKEVNFRDILLISFLIISINYCFRYIIETVFYHTLFVSFIHEQKHTGEFLGLLDSFANGQIRQPHFNLFGYLFDLPFFVLKMEILHFDIIAFMFTIVLDPKLYLLIILYHENLFLLFKKYKRNPWFSVIPVFNNYVLLKIVDKPGWWNFLLYVPFVRYVFLYFINIEIAKDFGKDKTFALAMTLLPSIFYGGICFGNSEIKEI